MKKLLFIFISLISIVYGQSPTKGALNTIDTVNKPTIKMLAVNRIDNLPYYWNLSSWAKLSISGNSGSAWDLAGNSGTSPGTNFIGTTDANDLQLRRNSILGLTIASGKTVIAGNLELPQYPSTSTTGIIYQGTVRAYHTFSKSGTTGDNAFIGPNAGNLSLTGSSSGDQGSLNTAVGPAAMLALTTGSRNTATGTYAMQNTTTGQGNTASGYTSLFTNTSGDRNVATGMRSLVSNTSGFANVAVGFDALTFNTTADHNVAVGLDALYYSNGSYNTAIGDSTLWGLYFIQEHVGSKNTAIGSRAGYHLGDTYPNFASIYDTAVSFFGANTSRDSSVPYTTSLQNSTAIGYGARFYASNQVVIGNPDVTSMILRGSVGLGTNTPNSAAILDLTTTTKGLLLPRMTKAQRDAISSPVAGLMIFQTDNTPGLRTYNGTNWVRYTETID